VKGGGGVYEKGEGREASLTQDRYLQATYNKTLLPAERRGINETLQAV
jgi:hypothetical protein